ncbi:hypothetical protein CSB07_00595 [Candidatus Gracilibacteria bacterium]|nr:MAG: hypothetical protein CSB07_00595 [Candidatus Gracilibacteria bacterium]PIE85629.1 MAG: hypothetical protein CSA08_01065 [Candidatus Gracilibacteria bacterium]
MAELLFKLIELPIIIPENFLNFINISTDASVKSLFIIMPTILVTSIALNIFILIIGKGMHNSLKFKKKEKKILLFLFIPFISPFIFGLFGGKINKENIYITILFSLSYNILFFISAISGNFYIFTFIYLLWFIGSIIYAKKPNLH